MWVKGHLDFIRALLISVRLSRAIMESVNRLDNPIFILFIINEFKKLEKYLKRKLLNCLGPNWLPWLQKVGSYMKPRNTKILTIILTFLNYSDNSENY